MTYVLSDIHGNLQRFKSIMTQINLQTNDTLYVLGDVIDRTGHKLIICHQINCQGIMGAGLAKQIHAMFPQVYEMYQRNCTQAANRQDLLGKVLFCPIQYNRCENKFKGIWQNGNLIYIFKCLNTVFALIMSGIIFFNNYVLCILRNI